MILPFGKFRGEDIEDVPNTYLEWLYDHMRINYKKDELLHKAIGREIQDREFYGIYITENKEKRRTV